MIAVAFFVLAGIAAGAPILAAVVVSVASRREESQWSLSRPDPGPMQAAARRIVDFRTEAPGLLPESKSRVLARSATCGPGSNSTRQRLPAGRPQRIPESRGRARFPGMGTAH